MIEQIKAKIGQPKIIRDIAEFRLEPTVYGVLDIETHGVNGKVGDSACYEHHGICGIAIGNANGDAVYMVVNDGRDYSGIPIKAAVDAINLWLSKVKVLLMHYSKFDLGFLLHRGLDVSKVILRDTWMIHNLKSQGNYTANKLKEIVRKKLGIDTNTETAKDDEMSRLKTEDYGDVTPEIMGTYACDDVRYTMLALLISDPMTPEEQTCHDLYMRNNLHLIAAEERGICLNLELLKARLKRIDEGMEENAAKIKDQLGAAQINFDDEQEMLKYLHQKNLHSEPREQYGEVKFVFNGEFLRSVEHPLVDAYHQYYRRKQFRLNFSTAKGNMMPRVFREGENIGFRAQHLSSVFSKGGLTLCKQPEFSPEAVHLTNEIREIFTPRKNHEFVVLRCVDLPTMLLAYYSNDAELLAAARSNQVVPTLAKRLGMEKETKQVSLLLRQQFEGSGAGVLELRMRVIGARFSGKKTIYALVDKFAAGLPGYAAMRKNLENAITADGFVRDRLGRVLRIDPNKLYRAHSMLIQSSHGSLLSHYLDLFCRLGEKTNAKLVLAHREEFVFEVPAGDDTFITAARALSEQRLIDPVPAWHFSQGPVWKSPFLEAHDEALERL